MNSLYKGAIYLSLAASIWGGAYVASKYAMEVIPPFTLLFLRYIFAGITLVWLCRRANLAIIPAKHKGLLFLIGFAGYFLSIAAQFVGTKLSSAHMGAVITTLSPVFQSIFAILILHEKMTVKQVLATVISFSGVVAIVGMPGGGEEASPFSGIIALLLASLFWGYYSVLSRKASQDMSPLQITTGGILIATLFTIPAAAWEWGQWSLASFYTAPIIFSIFYLAIISTAVAFLYWNKGLALVPSHNAGLFFFFQPLVGSLLGWVLLGEALTLGFIVGSSLVLAGVYYSMSSKAAASAATEG